MHPKLFTIYLHSFNRDTSRNVNSQSDNVLKQIYLKIRQSCKDAIRYVTKTNNQLTYLDE